MHPKRIRRRWKQIRGNKNLNKDYRTGWLQGMLWKTENMEDGAFMGYMEECLGEEWIQVLEEHGLVKETRND